MSFFQKLLPLQGIASAQILPRKAA
jgi:hypothetical protein